MKRHLSIFAVILAMTALFYGCADKPQSSSAILEEAGSSEIAVNDTAPKTLRETEDASSSSVPAASDASGEDIFPYLPEPFDPMTVFPSYYDMTGQFDTSLNNCTLLNSSFYLDDNIFYEDVTEHENFLRYKTVEDSPIGPIQVSILGQPVHTLTYFVSDADGNMMEIPTLNQAAQEFMAAVPAQPFTYFSETIRDHYMPGGMFYSEDFVGFFYYFSDGENAYSLQILTYDQDYAIEQQHFVIDLVNSILIQD